MFMLYNVVEVGFLLHGTLYGNNSIVNLSDIGEDSKSLLCLTNKTDCCSDPGTPTNVGSLGKWYFPNNTAVRKYMNSNDLYQNNGLSVVRLNRRSNITSPTGLFSCEIPDDNGIKQTIYVGVYSLGYGKRQI